MQPTMNPIAQSLAGQGRYGDSMLVHMNPQEVAGLQALAMRQGGSLTVNPETGLPEAFGLKNILPMVAGAALTPVMGPAGAALAVGGLGTLMSGSIEQGLMMGLGAYGGAQMAGSFANLAAPAADVAAASGAEFAAQQAAANAAAQQATTQAAAAANIPAPTDVFGNILGIDEMAVAGGQGVSAGLPANTSLLPKPPVSGISKLFQPDERTTYENIGAGMKKAFSSGENAMNFLGNNKMNLAMSAAPMLIPETPEEIEKKQALFSPYTYQVDNLSGAPVDPYGTETERLRGRFVAGTPYYAAKGGLMSLAEGGSASGEASAAAEAPATQTMTPAQADVFRNIFAVQQMAGMPVGMPGPAVNVGALPTFNFAPSAPRPPVAYTPSMVGSAPTLDTSEQRYTVFDPVTATKESSPISSDKEAAMGLLKGIAGLTRLVTESGRKNPTGSGVSPSNMSAEERAQYSFAGGGVASLRENDFILPADVISHMGNGSSDAGMEIAITQFKARPIKGAGDGMSDSIPTDIEGKQKALVAHEEALIPREMVAFLGGGSVEKGAAKLEKFMDRVRKARTGKKKQAPEINVARYMPA